MCAQYNSPCSCWCALWVVKCTLTWQVDMWLCIVDWCPEQVHTTSSLHNMMLWTAYCTWTVVVVVVLDIVDIMNTYLYVLFMWWPVCKSIVHWSAHYTWMPSCLGPDCLSLPDMFRGDIELRWVSGWPRDEIMRSKSKCVWCHWSGWDTGNNLSQQKNF